MKILIVQYYRGQEYTVLYGSLRESTQQTDGILLYNCVWDSTAGLSSLITHNPMWLHVSDQLAVAALLMWPLILRRVDSAAINAKSIFDR